MKNFNILFFDNIPSPYRVDFYNCLGQKCNLTVAFELQKSTERDEEWHKFNFLNFTGIIMKTIKLFVDSGLSFSYKKIIRSQKWDMIIVTNFMTPTGILTVNYLKKHKIPYILESDGGFPKKDMLLKNKIKKFVISNASLCLSTGKTNDDYFLNYGAKKENIKRYHFSSIHNNDILEFNQKQNFKQILRKKYSINEDTVIILFSGQIIYRKGVDLVLKCANHFSYRKNIVFYIIGGDIQNSYIKNENIKIPNNVVNIKFVPFSIMKEYMILSDYFFLPTREDIWGLVINEALAFGLPVITTEQCLAGTELVENSINGYLFNVYDYNRMIAVLDSLLNEKYCDLCNNALVSAKKYTIEEMVNDHINIFSKIN